MVQVFYSQIVLVLHGLADLYRSFTILHGPKVHPLHFPSWSTDLFSKFESNLDHLKTSDSTTRQQTFAGPEPQAWYKIKIQK